MLSAFPCCGCSVPGREDNGVSGGRGAALRRQVAPDAERGEGWRRRRRRGADLPQTDWSWSFPSWPGLVRGCVCRRVTSPPAGGLGAPPPPPLTLGLPGRPGGKEKEPPILRREIFHPSQWGRSWSSTGNGWDRARRPRGPSEGEGKALLGRAWELVSARWGGGKSCRGRSG